MNMETSIKHLAHTRTAINRLQKDHDLGRYHLECIAAINFLQDCGRNPRMEEILPTMNRQQLKETLDDLVLKGYLDLFTFPPKRKHVWFLNWRSKDVIEDFDRIMDRLINPPQAVYRLM